MPVTFKHGRWSALLDVATMGQDLRVALWHCAEELNEVCTAFNCVWSTTCHIQQSYCKDTGVTNDTIEGSVPFSVKWFSQITQIEHIFSQTVRQSELQAWGSIWFHFVQCYTPWGSLPWSTLWDQNGTEPSASYSSSQDIMKAQFLSNMSAVHKQYRS